MAHFRRIRRCFLTVAVLLLLAGTGALSEELNAGQWVEWQVEMPAPQIQNEPGDRIRLRCRIRVDRIAEGKATLTVRIHGGGVSSTVTQAGVEVKMLKASQVLSDEVTEMKVEPGLMPMLTGRLSVLKRRWTIESGGGRVHFERWDSDTLYFGPAFLRAGDVKIRAVAAGEAEEPEFPFPGDPAKLDEKDAGEGGTDAAKRPGAGHDRDS